MPDKVPTVQWIDYRGEVRVPEGCVRSGMKLVEEVPFLAAIPLVAEGRLSEKLLGGGDRGNL